MTKIALNNQIKTISTQRVNLAIFDPRVDDLSVLLGGLQPGVCAHVLDSERDGVEQISEILRQQPTASLTLVAHGFPGGLQLGAGTLELDNLHRYASQLRSWFERGDASSLTLLACNVATGDAGAEFVTQVASLTGVTVSAASTPVGNGQWPLVAANTFTSTVFEAYVATLGVSFNQVFKDETDGVDGLDGAYSVTVSPDGKQVFVASSTDDALTVFDRDASGNLTFKTVFKNGTDGVDGLDSARAVTVSPDGKQVFVTGSNDDALAVFDRDDSGNLTFKTVFKDETNGVDGLDSARAVTVSPDGKQVFVTGSNDDALTVFDRDDSGNLTFRTVFKDETNGVDGLNGAYSVTVSPDGKQVFVAGSDDNALAVFDRDDSGNLTFRTVFKDETNGVDGLNGAYSVTVSPDGKQVFVTGLIDDALAVFDRDDSGNLTFNKVFKNGIDGVDGLDGAYSVTVSPDGNQVFVASLIDDTLVVFGRDESGNLTFNQVFKNGIDGVDGLDSARAVTVSPDGNQVFVASSFDDALVVFNSDAAATLTVQADGDNDGITDDTEITAGDVNQDGTPDSQQTNVASTETITIVSSPGTTISDVQITANTSPRDPENQGITLPFGLLDFKLAGLTSGASTTVTLLLAQGQNYNTFWKYGKTPDNDQERWYEFLYDGETGAQFFDTDNDGKTDQIVLHFVDGKRGDADLIANGVIVDSGTPGITNTDLSLSKSITEDIWSVEGDVGAAVAKISLVGKNTTQVNEVGLFKVDANNRVNGIAPGETGFAQAALQEGEVVFSSLSDDLLNGVDLNRKLQVGAGERLVFYFISDGTTDAALNSNNFDNVFFSVNAGNTNNQDYLQVSENNGIYTLNWEQGNDNSFNDLVMNFQLENTPLTTQNLIANYQGQQESELINLQSFTAREVKATFTIHREADYNNFVSFYRVDDTQGTVTDELTGNKLKPGDEGYAELVVKQRISGVELTVGNNQSVTVEDTLSGGSFFAPFMIADANPDNLNGDFSKVYTPYIMGNSDKADHIRLLADNTFGFEDLAVGGDNDFNDLIVSASFQVV